VSHTLVALEVLSEQGVIFWHDYQFGGYFHGMGGIPEALKHFSTQHSLVAINGTILAMSSRYPGWETSRILKSLPTKSGVAAVWKNTAFRG
jgi:hypothetical protein